MCIFAPEWRMPGAEMDFTRKRVSEYGSRKQKSAKRAWAQDPRTSDSENRTFASSQAPASESGRYKRKKKEDGGLTHRYEKLEKSARLVALREAASSKN
jgi:hypothetical protein